MLAFEYSEFTVQEYGVELLKKSVPGISAKLKKTTFITTIQKDQIILVSTKAEIISS